MDYTHESLELLSEQISTKIDPNFGRKVLEYGSGICSAASMLRKKCDYLAVTDKDPAALEGLRAAFPENEINIIPDSELSEDCYFGRFHLVYTLFALSDSPHTVDEIMRLRRLILKGGKLLIAGFDSDNLREALTKQLKRCGFTEIQTEFMSIEGKAVFILTAIK